MSQMPFTWLGNDSGWTRRPEQRDGSGSFDFRETQVWTHLGLKLTTLCLTSFNKTLTGPTCRVVSERLMRLWCQILKTTSVNTFPFVSQQDTAKMFALTALGQRIKSGKQGLVSVCVTLLEIQQSRCSVVESFGKQKLRGKLLIG